MYTLVQLAVYIRITIALFTRTFFQPDEYFQSLEPAHHLVFGYGSLTWEWTSSQPIRSIIYPALNVPIYYLLKITGLSEGQLGDLLLIACPKILHGFLAAGTDIYIGEIARITLGGDYVSTAMFVSLTSFFNALALSRSLSNSLETTLTTVAFAHYPWDISSKLSPQLMFNRSKLKTTILFSALACIVRPTNAVIWVFLYANLLWAVRHHPQIRSLMTRDIVTTGIWSLVVLFLIDSMYYETPTITPLNFLMLNLSNVSLFYGANPWHYYITQAIPILCTTALPFTLHGIWTTVNSKIVHNTPQRTMLATIIWTVTVYSFAGHKEWRFLHPILPLLHVFAAKSIIDLSSTRLTVNPEAKVAEKPSKLKTIPQIPTVIHETFQLPNIRIKYLAVLLATIPASLYVTLFYCSAPISVLSYIRSIPRNERGRSTIGVLMPCHSLPGQAYIHRPQLAIGMMWVLSCEPPLEGQELSTYQDQTDEFYASPIDYFHKHFPKDVNPRFPPSVSPGFSAGLEKKFPQFQRYFKENPQIHEWPMHLIFFGQLLQEVGVRDLLEKQGYKEVWKAGREWEGEGKRKGGVRVWRSFVSEQPARFESGRVKGGKQDWRNLASVS